MAVILTKKQTVKVIHELLEREDLDKVINAGLLRVHKEGTSKLYKLEFLTIDFTDHKELVEPLLPKELK
jgi:hypothetical protein